MSNEFANFAAWFSCPSNWKELQNWTIDKVSQRLKRFLLNRYSTHQYPSEIQSLLDSTQNAVPLEKSNQLEPGTKTTAIDPPNVLPLAGTKFPVYDGCINWQASFIDSEDEESLHRWNWLIQLTSEQEMSPGKLRWALAMKEDWVQRFQQEIQLQNGQLNRLLRWDSYTVGERVANSVLFYHCKKFPPSLIIRNALVEQVKLLTNRLEYFGKQTGNHVCNNARAIYLAGVVFVPGSS